ncbi:ATPase [Dryocola sp. BD626]|uniref:ATPase n=1 Tax=Dryocola sp. BD626 TaxID=3133273 RepID=UPI003F4F85E2
MSEANKPVAENTLSKKENNTVQVRHESVQAYFRIDTQEFIFLTDDASSALDEHATKLMVSVDAQQSAKAIYSLAVEEFGKVYSQPQRAAELASLEAQVVEAEKDLQKKQLELQDKLGEFAVDGAGYESVVELLPIATKNNQGRNRGVGSRYSYVKKGYYDRLGAGVKHKVKLKAKDKASAAESIFERDNDGRIKRIDTKKLKEQLTSLDFSAPDTGIKFWSAEDLVKVDETLTGWADSWNKSLILDKKEIGQCIDVGAGAQFMRFTSNAGASGEWDPVNGELTFKSEASAVLSLASGTADAKIYMPDRIGWSLKFNSEKSTTPIDMGMLRLYLETSLIGFAGASVQAEAQLQVTTINGKQLLVGQSKKRLPRFSERRASGAEFHKQMDENEEGLRASGEIFGGARAEFKLTGGVQWLQPIALTSHQGKSGDEAKAAGEFVDFCSVSESVVGMVGAGIGGTFQCDFVNGRFCFKIAASLCMGIGAKGSFEASVAYDKLMDFGGWLAYQLYGLDYAFFELIAERAFEAFSKVCVMLLSDMKEEIAENLKLFSDDLYTIGDRYDFFIHSVDEGINASKKRNQLACNINTKPGVLLNYTPESKGMLLYLLTRHGVWDHFDLDNRGDGIIPDIYFDRKKAVVNVLFSIQTQREWFQVFCHRTEDGSSLANNNSALKYMVAQNQMNEIRDFLQEGLDNHDEMDAIYRRLKVKASWGYALMMNDTMGYRLHTENNPFYPKLAVFSPVNQSDLKKGK